MKQTKKNKIRIISGEFRGQKIFIKKTYKVRPTTDRMRETLFNWIHARTINANCLDCFSGSGALGIEALSRYASFVTFIEKHKRTAYELKKTIIKFKKQNIKIINADATKWLNKIRKPYDIIFLDPPFNTELLQNTIIQLDKYKYTKMYSLIYIEQARTSKKLFIPYYWTLYKEKKTLNVHYQLYICQKNN
ncbi:MAG: 16S rRNA (guanine(966)-N(2))-methyltransferase RsmD [Buchnera aphidicola (Meitanaphis microgallis)]